MSSTAQTTPETPAFGSLLKAWRARRRVSQLDLALDADLSQRHVSFLESGRSKPTRASIEKLADALTIPRGERDRLFAAAGFTSPASLSPWTPEARAAIDESLAFILERHDPYPAMVVDRLWNVQRLNAAARGFFEMFGTPASANLVAAVLHPDGPRQALVNWREAAARLVGLIEIEVARRLDDGEGRALLLEIFDLPGVAEACAKAPDLGVGAPVMSLHFRLDGRDLRLFSLVATVGMSVDPGLEDLKLETLLPADAETRDWFLN
ncbi:helix-turn-helix domain-containing protein [Caulobacter sp. KR2-114]|uniref:helix-turn-helix domain-containing protein n=1 Tax=Caulobacter sp. KR2-114 TaxID=3400912 RepID=UPI003BFE941E